MCVIGEYVFEQWYRSCTLVVDASQLVAVVPCYK